jgi:hypothetical protein
MEDDSHGKDVLLLRSRMPENLRSESSQIHEDVMIYHFSFFGATSYRANKESEVIDEREIVSLRLETCKK